MTDKFDKWKLMHALCVSFLLRYEGRPKSYVGWFGVVRVAEDRQQCH